jgi:hypothetical protein
MTNYTEIKALNWSSLRLMETPAVFRHRQTNPRPDTPAFLLGRAMHCALLEPDKFETRHPVYRGAARRGKAWEAFLCDHQNSEPITEQERDAAVNMSQAVRMHAVAPGMIAGGRTELVAEWIIDGTRCKGRLDCVTLTRVVDIKTTRDAGPRWFGKAAFDYGYHGQLAWYHDGAVSAGLLSPGYDRPVIVAVEKDPPHLVAVYEVPVEVLDLGRELYRRLLAKYRACDAAGYWPGYEGLRELELPKWAWD